MTNEASRLAAIILVFSSDCHGIAAGADEIHTAVVSLVLQ